VPWLRWRLTQSHWQRHPFEMRIPSPPGPKRGHAPLHVRLHRVERQHRGPPCDAHRCDRSSPHLVITTGKPNESTGVHLRTPEHWTHWRTVSGVHSEVSSLVLGASSGQAAPELLRLLCDRGPGYFKRSATASRSAQPLISTHYGTRC
jgi:hypothetical protein